MKKVLVLFFMIMITLFVCSCDKKQEIDDSVNHDTITIGDYTYKKVTDYLYEVTYDNYEQYRAGAEEFFSKYNPKRGGCSSVQNGMIRGRNYDWTFDEAPEFVIHVPANDKGRHASLGVATTTEIDVHDLESGVAYDIYKAIPYLTLDGINDCGITININVVGYEEKGEYVMKNDDPSDDVCPFMVPRLVLDSCSCLDEAIELIGGLDIYSIGNVEEAHFMLSGPQSKNDSKFNTIVIELIPDENKHYALSVIDYNKGEFVDNKPVMTNFHLTDFDGTLASATKHPMGYERYQILNENFDEGKDVQGMFDLMKKVYYTRAYDLYIDNFWYSECCGGELDMTMVGEKNLHGDLSKAGVFAEMLGPSIESYKKMKRIDSRSDALPSDDIPTWHTVHTSIYDIENKTLYVAPQESGFTYKFELK